MQAPEQAAASILGCSPCRQPTWADGTEGASWCRTHRHKVNEWPCQEQRALADLIRARDAEVAEQVRANDPILRAWVEPGINPPYHERMKARVRKIMPVLARRLDEKAKGIR